MSLTLVLLEFLDLAVILIAHVALALGAGVTVPNNAWSCSNCCMGVSSYSRRRSTSKSASCGSSAVSSKCRFTDSLLSGVGLSNPFRAATRFALVPVHRGEMLGFVLHEVLAAARA